MYDYEVHKSVVIHITYFQIITSAFPVLFRAVPTPSSYSVTSNKKFIT